MSSGRPEQGLEIKYSDDVFATVPLSEHERKLEENKVLKHYLKIFIESTIKNEKISAIVMREAKKATGMP